MNEGSRGRAALRIAPKTGGEFAFVAPPPLLTGDPGERLAVCIRAESGTRGGKTQVLLEFETDEGETGLMWCEVPPRLTQNCRYMRLVRTALGYSPKVGEQIHPGNVFKGKRFRVFIGYRKTPHAKGRGGKWSDDLAYSKKDDDDYLRVHEILELVS